MNARQRQYVTCTFHLPISVVKLQLLQEDCSFKSGKPLRFNLYGFDDPALIRFVRV